MAVAGTVGLAAVATVGEAAAVAAATVVAVAPTVGLAAAAVVGDGAAGLGVTCAATRSSGASAPSAGPPTASPVAGPQAPAIDPLEPMATSAMSPHASILPPNSLRPISLPPV
jgi:hypothetical protein